MKRSRKASDVKGICVPLIILLSIIMLGQTLPSVPPTIAYQGRITDDEFPTIADGEYEFAFLIYDAAAGGNLLWSETQPAVSVVNGTYRVNLGEFEAIEFSALNQKDSYLEARVFGETLSPRRRIVSVPFALKAEGEVPEGGGHLG